MTETLTAALTKRYIDEELPDNTAERVISRVLNETAKDRGVLLGPVRYDERIHQSEGPMLVGEADVIVHLAPRMSRQISRRELKAMRAAVRRAAAKTFEDDRMTDEDCDAMIDKVGPEVVERMLRCQT